MRKTRMKRLEEENEFFAFVRMAYTTCAGTQGQSARLRSTCRHPHHPWGARPGARDRDLAEDQTGLNGGSGGFGEGMGQAGCLLELSWWQGEERARPRDHGPGGLLTHTGRPSTCAAEDTAPYKQRFYRFL